MKYHKPVRCKDDIIRIPLNIIKFHVRKCTPCNYYRTWLIACEHEVTTGFLWWKKTRNAFTLLQCFYPAFDSFSDDRWSDHVGFKTEYDANRVVSNLNKLYLVKSLEGDCHED